MATPGSAGRGHAPRRASVSAPARFDGYPYLVSRIGRCALRHIAVLPADWPREHLLALARAQAGANRLETAVCFGPDDAVYVGADGTRTWPGPTPSGLYVVERLRLAEPLPDTDELQARRARLTVFERAHNVGGFIVGDGAEDRRPARAAERLRLAGRGPDGLPAGVDRCATCGGTAGDYLIDGTEVVRCRCACENRNRCARCGLPLAEQALSSWRYHEDQGRAWYLAAYAAFSHRCPDEPTNRVRT
jgi:hypothetical protein